MHTIAELRQRIADAHADLLSAVEGLSEAAFRSPLVYEPWSAADLLAHCIGWDRMTAAGMSAARAAEAPPLVLEVRAKGAQAYDKEYTDQFLHATPEQLKTELAGTRDKVLVLAGRLDDDDLDRPLVWSRDGTTTLWKFIEGEHWGHRHEHAAEIRKWRAERGL